MRGYFTFNNIRSDQHGVYITGNETYSAPSKRYNFFDIPNRNGKILGNERKLENLQVTYDAFIAGGANFATNMEYLRNWLLSIDGYAKLSDSYHTDEYRMAVFEGPFNPKVQENKTENGFDGAKFTLTFNCMPQRWLTSGDTETEITGTSSVTFTNPTMFQSKPWFRAYGTGTFSVNGTYAVTVLSSYTNSYIDIDCETMEASYNGTPMNEYVEITVGSNTSVDYPFFKTGSNTIVKPAGFSKLIVKPRWWKV